MEKLALLGGPKAVQLDSDKEANRPIVTQDAIDAVVDMLRKDEISLSPRVGRFERDFAQYVGAKYSIMMCDGTSTLNSALFACKVAPGDEVIVPSYTFWGTTSPVIAHHAVPVFCDVDLDSHLMTAETIAPCITPKTKAIMVVHCWGSAVDMDPIMDLAKKHNLKVIEDCSHAHGTRYKGKPVGLDGDVGCYSLQGSKLMPGGEGGILVTNDRECFERANALGHYERLGALPDDSEYKKYRLTGMGEKFRVHPVAAALAADALIHLDERNKIRNSQGHALEAKIADIPFIKKQKQTPNSERVFSYHYMRFDSEKFGGISTETFLQALKAEGVVVGYCGYGRLHTAPAYTEGGAYGDCGPNQKQPVSLPNTEYLAEQTFMAAPRFENECPELIEQYAAAYHKVAANQDALLAYEKEKGVKKSVDLSGRSIALVR